MANEKPTYQRPAQSSPATSGRIIWRSPLGRTRFVQRDGAYFFVTGTDGQSTVHSEPVNLADLRSALDREIGAHGSPYVVDRKE